MPAPPPFKRTRSNAQEARPLAALEPPATRSNRYRGSAPKPNTDAHNAFQHSWHQFVQLWDVRTALILSRNSGSLCHNLSNTTMKARKNPAAHPSTPALTHRGRSLLTPPNTARAAQPTARLAPTCSFSKSSQTESSGYLSPGFRELRRRSLG